MATVFIAIGSLRATTIVNNGKLGYSFVQKHDSPVQSKLHHTAIPIVNTKQFETKNTGSFIDWNSDQSLNNKIYYNGNGNADRLYDNVYGSGYNGQYADYYVRSIYMIYIRLSLSLYYFLALSKVQFQLWC